MLPRKSILGVSCAAAAIAFISVVATNRTVSNPTDSSSKGVNSEKIVRRITADLGVIRPDSPYKCEFVIMNDFDDTWELAKVERSCSCIQVKCSALSVRPHDELRVVISSKTGPKPSGLLTRIVLRPKKLSAPIFVLEGTAVIRPELNVSQDDISANVLRGTSTAHSWFLVENYSDSDWPDISLECGDAWLSCNKLLTKDRNSVGRRQAWRVAVSIVPTGLAGGEHASQIKIRANRPDGAKAFTTSVGVRIRIDEPITISPTSLALQKHGHSSVPIIMERRDGTTLFADDVTVSIDDRLKKYLTWKKEQQSDKRVVVIVTLVERVDATTSSEILSSVVSLSVAGKDAAQIHVPLAIKIAG